MTHYQIQTRYISIRPKTRMPLNEFTDIQKESPVILKQDLVNNILANRETQEAKEQDKVLDFAAALINPKGHDSKKEWLSILNKSDKQVTLDGWVVLNQKGQVMNLKGRLQPGKTIKLMTKDFNNFSLNQ